MKKTFLRWLYKNNEAFFADLLVESFYGDIPSNLSEPAIDFLANGRTVLERFFSLQAYHIQRRAIGDMKNQQFYNGQLLFIKALILAFNRTRSIKAEPINTVKEKDPLEGVREFLNLAKNEKND